MDNGPPDFLQTEWEEQLSKISWILPPNSQWEWFIRVKKPMSCGCFTNLKAFSRPGNGFAVAPCSWSPSPREGTTVLINLKDHHPKIIPQPSTLNIHRFSTNQLQSSLNPKDKTPKHLMIIFSTNQLFNSQTNSTTFLQVWLLVVPCRGPRSFPIDATRTTEPLVLRRAASGDPASIGIVEPLVLLGESDICVFSRRAFENSPRCDVRKGKNIQLERRFGWEHPYHTVKTWWNDWKMVYMYLYLHIHIKYKDPLNFWTPQDFQCDCLDPEYAWITWLLYLFLVTLSNVSCSCLRGQGHWNKVVWNENSNGYSNNFKPNPM